MFVYAKTFHTTSLCFQFVKKNVRLKTFIFKNNCYVRQQNSLQAAHIFLKYLKTLISFMPRIFYVYYYYVFIFTYFL